MELMLIEFGHGRHGHKPLGIDEAVIKATQT